MRQRIDSAVRLRAAMDPFLQPPPWPRCRESWRTPPEVTAGGFTGPSHGCAARAVRTGGASEDIATSSEHIQHARYFGDITHIFFATLRLCMGRVMHELIASAA